MNKPPETQEQYVTAEPYDDGLSNSQRAANTAQAWAKRTAREQGQFREMMLNQAESSGNAVSENDIGNAWNQIMGINSVSLGGAKKTDALKPEKKQKPAKSKGISPEQVADGQDNGTGHSRKWDR